MEKLPFDVLEYIVGYLSVKDLSKCCTVCSSWREVFSDDIFWRKYCNVELSVYLESSTCLVEPCFNTPYAQNSRLIPVSGWRLHFLREQHYLNNLRSGQCKKKKIEFDCREFMEVEFVANDYLFLHTTFETQVWNTAQEPNLIMRVPFKFICFSVKNLYKFQDNKLIIVQLNVVQMFNICLLSKTWSFLRTFFFDKPERFSLNITKDTDVNKMLKTSFGKSGYGIICSNFLIGIVRDNETETSPKNTTMHIWDLNCCKKVKEECCSGHLGPGVSNVCLETSPTTHDKIIVSCQKSLNSCIVVYSLAQLKFLASYQCRSWIDGKSLLCNGYLYIYKYTNNTILRVNLETNVAGNMCKFGERGHSSLCCLHIICGKIVGLDSNDLVLINPLSETVKVECCGDFELGSFDVVKDKYLALHDSEGSLRELWELRTVDNKQNTFVKLFSLPPFSGTYRTSNKVCTKMALTYANKLIVLNFW